MATLARHRTLGKKLIRILIKSVLFVVLFLLVVLLLIMTPPVQRIIKNKFVAYLERKLDTEVSVGSLYIGLPKVIVAEDLYIEDRQRDTLLSIGRLDMDVALTKLIFKGKIDINKVSLENSTIKIRRQLPDTTFNFQFLVDAFTPTPDTTSTASGSGEIKIGSVRLQNTRCIYSDVVSGSNATIQLNDFYTKLGRINPDSLYFDIPATKIDGLVATYKQTAPLAKPESVAKDVAEAAEPSPMHLGFRTLDLNNIKFNYENNTSAVYSQLDIGEMDISMNSLDLQQRIIDIDLLALKNSTTSLRFGKKPASAVVARELQKEIETRKEAGWRVLADEIDIDNHFLRFNNDNNPPAAHGMDYSHLKADSFQLTVNDFIFSDDSIGGKIISASFLEQSGFVLNELQAEALYSRSESYLKNLYLRTPGTEIKRKAAIAYSSVDVFSNNIGELFVDAEITDSRILVSDLLTFAPALTNTPAFSNPHETIYINSRFWGKLDAIRIELLQIHGLHETSIDMHGNVAGLVSGRNTTANLNIRNFSTSKRDVGSFVSLRKFPPNITIPERIRLSGTIATRSTTMQGDLRVYSTLGTVWIKGNMNNWNDPARMSYTASVQTNDFDAATFLKNKNLGNNIAATFAAKGTGTTPATMNLAVNGNIRTITILDYTYRNINVNATVANQLLHADVRLKDPNIDITAIGNAKLSGANPTLRATVMVDSMKFQALHLTPNEFIYRGKIEADFSDASLSAPIGNMLITQSLMVTKDKRVDLDTILLQTGRNSNGRFVTVASELANASLTGQYDLVELPEVFVHAIQPYFRINDRPTPALKPYNFNIDVTITNNKGWTIIIPRLERMQPITLKGNFSNAGWSATANAPLVETKLERLNAFNATAATKNDSLEVTASIGKFYLNRNFQLGPTSVSASLANNNMDFALNSKDLQLQNKYHLEGNFQYAGPRQYTLTLHPRNLLLNYETWNISPRNRISINGNDIHINDFALSRNSQQLTIESLGTQRNAPLQANFTNFQVQTITGLIQADSTLVDGLLNGQVKLEQLAPRPIFTADVIVKDLQVYNDTTGDLHLLVNNKTSDTYEMNATLSGRENDLVLSGNYHPYSPTNNLNLDLDIKRLSVKTIETFSNGTIYNGSGLVNGHLYVSGSIAKPAINGDVNFSKTVFAVKYLNDHFEIDNEKLTINNQGIDLDNFIIKDSAGNEMRLNGKIATTDFVHYRFDTRLQSTNFRLLNTTKKQNQYAYGQLYVNADLTIRGNEDLPIIDGTVAVNEKTNLVMLLPQKEPAIVRSEGIVEFVRFDSPNDSLFMRPDTILADFFVGTDIAVTIETSKEADFTLIIDEGNGDFLHIKGTTLLSAASDRSGNLILSGTFELESGAYELSFNLLKRRFDIQKGSRITWEGAPTTAEVDITAKYVAEVAPLELVKNQLSESSTEQRNTYMQRLPFEVVLKMEGNLMEPVFTFDINLPNDKSYGVSQDVITNVQTRLEQLRQEEGDMNKQVFSLLLLNRFVADNPFAGMNNSFNAGRFARQSVSRLLSEQLNRLAADLVAGVEIKFDVESYEDYTSGEKSNRTDLNVGLSKRLLSDRLTVTVGSNFAIEGSQSTQQTNGFVGDIAVDYKISRDGRYVLRGYRKNDYYGVLEGYIIETGVGFIMTIDYNRFREIFQSSKKRQQRQRNKSQP